MCIDSRGSFGEHFKSLLKQFPFIRQRRTVFNDRPRPSKRMARILDIEKAPVLQYEI